MYMLRRITGPSGSSSSRTLQQRHMQLLRRALCWQSTICQRSRTTAINHIHTTTWQKQQQQQQYHCTRRQRHHSIQPTHNAYCTITTTTTTTKSRPAQTPKPRSHTQRPAASTAVAAPPATTASSDNNVMTPSEPPPKHGRRAPANLLPRSPEEARTRRDEALQLPELVLSARQMCDIELLLNGGFAPLTGFMTKPEYDSVVHHMRLPVALDASSSSSSSSSSSQQQQQQQQHQGTLWPMPITLDVQADTAARLVPGQSSLALKDWEGNILAILDVQDVYQPDKQAEAQFVFGGDPEHPAIQYLVHTAGSHYVGGALRGIRLPPHYDHRDLRLGPAQLHAYFEEQGWTGSNIVAFQTRNPLHRAHFELTVRACEDYDARLLLHPVVGMTKPGDIDHHTRVKCYRAIMHKYEEGRAKLSALPLAMRMGGPREALWHAIIRQNYGATHFILGRDHAGPGANSAGKDFYGPYDARDFALHHQSELDIKLVPFEMMVYVDADKSYYPANRVPEGVEAQKLSGTEVRRRLQTGGDIPEWFSFPEVVKILRSVHKPKHKQGFCVFFTGLSGSGKTTVANALLERLMETDERPITVLDGDHVRQMLSSELGFSSEDRRLNVKRIGYVSGQVVRPGGAVIAAPIAPYDDSRKFARREVEGNGGGFILVHLSTPVTVCETRDRKGLYAKVRQGKLKHFTGIDDPYEEPEDAEIVIDTGSTDVHEAVDIIVADLQARGYLVV